MKECLIIGNVIPGFVFRISTKQMLFGFGERNGFITAQVEFIANSLKAWLVRCRPSDFGQKGGEKKSGHQYEGGPSHLLLSGSGLVSVKKREIGCHHGPWAHFGLHLIGAKIPVQY